MLPSSIISSSELKLEFIIQLICLYVCLNLVQANTLNQTIDNVAKTEADEEFAHLLNRVAAASSRRVHLISEHTRNGHRLQLEEFLDLESWNQLLQFKWHEDEKLEGGNESQVLSTKKINVIILNTGIKKAIVQYEPYSCYTRVIDTNSSSTTEELDEVDWWEFVADSLAMKANDMRIKPRQRHTETIQSLISQAPNSPYFARVPINDELNGQREIWAFGLTGLWLKAQYSGSENSTLGRIFHYQNGVKIMDSEAWRLDLEYANSIILYYFNTAFMGFNEQHKLSGGKSNVEYDVLDLVELRHKKSTHLIDMINVIDADLLVSDQLARDLFKLPIGYNCKANPNLSMSGIYLDNAAYSGLQATLRELEIVVTRYGLRKQEELSTYSSTNVKSLSLASCKHPMNSANMLSLFHIPEDRFKIIRDYHSRISYELKQSDNGTKNHCKISGLHIFDFNHRQSTEPIEVQFENGIIMNLNEVFLDYLFNYKKSPGNEQQFLNLIEVSEDKEELVFESQVPESYRELVQVTDQKTGEPLARSISLVRVYERSYSNKNNIYKMRRKEAPKLVRIILVVFDHKRQEKLAEIRFNLIKTISPLSFARRAQLFDVSKCHEEDTMELLVSYPIESNSLIEYAAGRSHELVDEFYLSSINWAVFDGEKLVTNTSLEVREKQHLGISLNFLRVPKVELLSSSNGELRLRLLILDKVSPIYLFDQIIESTFVSNSIDEKFLLSNELECAHYCRLHNCRMFAFDTTSLECKLSPVSVEDQLEEDEDESDDEIKPTVDNYVTVVRKLTSKIYYAPARQDNVDSQAPFEEATLAELHSYLEHHIGELDLELFQDLNEEEDEDEEDNFVLKSRRKTRDLGTESLNKWPLLSFQFTDRSDPKRKYSSPERRLLVPSGIKAIKIPFTIDVSGESQKVKVAGALRTNIVGKKFQLNLLDDPNWMPKNIFNSDERTFFDRSNYIYYSFKRLQQFDIENCALMCYNIDTWDNKARAEQICQSFSYCSEQKECTLMVKTDVNFTESLIDLVQEGDRVLDLNSTDQLQVNEVGCIVSARNYLAGFEGPIRLLSGKYGYKSTGYLQSRPIDYEWLSVFNIESSDIYEDSQDRCAKECVQRNKLGRRCLALDFCIIKTPPNFKANQTITRYETVCDLLLLHEETPEASSESRMISQIREQLIQTATGAAYNRSTNGVESTCNRYLISHLSEFTHIKMRQFSQDLMDKLERPAPTMENLNLDSCALECSTRKTECLAFEYCNKIVRQGVLEKSCNLFGGPKGSISQSKEKSKVQTSVSTYSRDCHVYLKKDYKSLEDLLELEPAKVSGTFEHGELLFYCTLLYIICVIALLLYYRSTIRVHRRFV